MYLTMKYYIVRSRRLTEVGNGINNTDNVIVE